MRERRSLSLDTGLLWLGLMGDCATTRRGVQRHGLSYEANPIGRFLLRRIGMRGVVALLTSLCLSLHRSLHVLQSERPRTVRRLLWVVRVLTAIRWIVVLANARTLRSRPSQSDS
jgi:hypothetical protein